MKSKKAKRLIQRIVQVDQLKKAVSILTHLERYLIPSIILSIAYIIAVEIWGSAGNVAMILFTLVYLAYAARWMAWAWFSSRRYLHE